MHSKMRTAHRRPGAAARVDAATEGLPGPRSLANSAAVLVLPQSTATGCVRGCVVRHLGGPGPSGEDFGLRPAMTLSTRLIARTGSPVASDRYSATWEAPEAMPVGWPAIGYGDGYRGTCRRAPGAAQRAAGADHRAGFMTS